MRGSSEKRSPKVYGVQTGFHQRLVLKHTRAIPERLLGRYRVSWTSPNFDDQANINIIIIFRPSVNIIPREF